MMFRVHTRTCQAIGIKMWSCLFAVDLIFMLCCVSCGQVFTQMASVSLGLFLKC